MAGLAGWLESGAAGVAGRGSGGVALRRAFRVPAAPPSLLLAPGLGQAPGRPAPATASASPAPAPSPPADEQGLGSARTRPSSPVRGPSPHAAGDSSGMNARRRRSRTQARHGHPRPASAVSASAGASALLRHNIRSISLVESPEHETDGGQEQVTSVDELLKAFRPSGDAELDMCTYNAVIRLPPPTRHHQRRREQPSSSALEERVRELIRNHTIGAVVTSDSGHLLMDSAGFSVRGLPQAGAAGEAEGAGAVENVERAFRRRRLALCLELLESVEQQGKLDMRQVYHARFFDECKAAEDVGAALRFMRLILAPSPASAVTAAGQGAEGDTEAAPSPEEAKNLLRSFNQLMAVCAHCADSQGALKAFRMATKAGLRPDVRLYTALISALCRASQLDMAFKFFYEMEGKGLKPNNYTMCTLINACGKQRLVAKAFGLYGMMLTKKMKPDRAVYNALINACVLSGSIERAFDILSDMRQEKPPVAPDASTAGALLRATFSCPSQRVRALQVFDELRGISPALDAVALEAQGSAGAVLGGGRQAASACAPSSPNASVQQAKDGTPGAARRVVQKQGVKVYTAAVHACSAGGDWDQALRIFEDLKRDGVKPDEIFFSALIDVACHSRHPEGAEAVVHEMQRMGVPLGTAVSSALMTLYSQTGMKDAALALYRSIKTSGIQISLPTFNALISLLCAEGDLEHALKVVADMKGLSSAKPDGNTYSLLLEACLRSEVHSGSRSPGGGGLLALKLYNMAQDEGVRIGLKLCDVIVDLCAEMLKRDAPPPPPAFILLLQQSLAPRPTPAPSAPGRGQGVPPLGLGRGGGAYPTHPEMQFGAPMDVGRRLRSMGGLGGMGFRPLPMPVPMHMQSAQAKREEEEQARAAAMPLPPWCQVALAVYQQSLASGVVPTMNVLAKLLGLLRMPLLPYAVPAGVDKDATGEAAQQEIEGSAGSEDSAAEGAGAEPAGTAPFQRPAAYHPVAFALYEEAERLGAVPVVSAGTGPITLRLEAMPPNLAEVCFLVLLRNLEKRQRAAPGLALFPLSIHMAVASWDLVLPPQKPVRRRSTTPVKGRAAQPESAAGKSALQSPRTRQLQVASRTGQAVAALLRRLDLPFVGSESEGVLHITSNTLTSWLRSSARSALLSLATLATLPSLSALPPHWPGPSSATPSSYEDPLGPGYSSSLPGGSSGWEGEAESVQQMLQKGRLRQQRQGLRVWEGQGY